MEVVEPPSVRCRQADALLSSLKALRALLNKTPKKRFVGIKSRMFVLLVYFNARMGFKQRTHTQTKQQNFYSTFQFKLVMPITTKSILLKIQNTMEKNSQISQHAFLFLNIFCIFFFKCKV